MKGTQYKVENLVVLNLIQLPLADIIRVQLLLLGRFVFFNNFNRVKNSVSLQ